jgi:CheY-like chemotaxis protein
MNSKPITILLAEDDEEDRYLIGEALDEGRVPNHLYVVEDGEQLLDYLYRRGKFADSEQWPDPDLILLDLNMPRKDGREVLEEIKVDPGLRRTPIVVLTTSRAQEDIARSYNQGVSGFVTKPVTFRELMEVMKTIGAYWGKTSTLPPK